MKIKSSGHSHSITPQLVAKSQLGTWAKNQTIKFFVLLIRFIRFFLFLIQVLERRIILAAGSCVLLIDQNFQVGSDTLSSMTAEGFNE